MAEEDLIYGKKRHLFGGIEPSNMKEFYIEYEDRKNPNFPDSNGSVVLTAILPDDTVVDGQTLCTVAGAVIRRKKGSYPENEFDGELVADIHDSKVITLEDVDPWEDDPYLYAAFPYTTQGVYNRNPINRTYYHDYYLYGYDLNIDDPNPATRVHYPDDVDNATFAAAGMDEETETFKAGDWNISSGYKSFMPRPCMLKYDGTVDYYLSPSNYGLKSDNSTPSDVANMSYEGNAMMQWPKIYTKRWEEDGIYHFRCSDIKLDEDYECWSNYDKNNNEIPYFYTPIYNGAEEELVDDAENYSYRMRSISGQACLSGLNVAGEIEEATLNGDGWFTEVLADRMLINDLLVLMGKSTNTQDVFGMGNVSGSEFLNTGTMDDKGLFWGNWDETSGVKVFGMENYWGNYRRRIAGWMNCKGVQKIKMTQGTKDGSTAEDYNLTGEGYITVAEATQAFSGYISRCKTTPYGRFPIEGSGSATTYECDRVYTNVTRPDGYAIVGGSRSNDLYAGAFYAYLGSAPSHTYSYVGAALSCKPLVS